MGELLWVNGNASDVWLAELGPRGTDTSQTLLLKPDVELLFETFSYPSEDPLNPSTSYYSNVPFAGANDTINANPLTNSKPHYCNVFGAFVGQKNCPLQSLTNSIFTTYLTNITAFYSNFATAYQKLTEVGYTLTDVDLPSAFEYPLQATNTPTTSPSTAAPTASQAPTQTPVVTQAPSQARTQSPVVSQTPSQSPIASRAPSISPSQKPILGPSPPITNNTATSSGVTSSASSGPWVSTATGAAAVSVMVVLLAFLALGGFCFLLARRRKAKARWDLSGPEAYPESSDSYSFALAPGAAAYTVPHAPTPLRANTYYNEHEEEAPFEAASGEVESLRARTALDSPRASVQQVWGAAGGGGVGGVRQSSVGIDDNTVVRWRGSISAASESHL